MNAPDLSGPALSSARRGLPIFPCWAGSKLPAFPRSAVGAPSTWQSFATSNLLSLAEKWAENPSYNPAVFTRGYVVIDVDAYKSGVTLETFTSLGAVPDTYTVRTARGGYHFYFKTDEPFGNSRGTLPPGIDVRGHGGYVLGTGAVFEGRRYEVINDVDPAPLPDWLARMLRTVTKAPNGAGAMLGSEDTPEAVERARAYVATAAPAIEGEGGDHQTYKVCVRLRRDFNLSIEAALDVLEPWNNRCLPPWDLDDLTKKLENAGQYGQNLAGTDNPLVGLEPIAPAPSPSRLVFTSDISLDAIRKRSETALVEGLFHRGDLGVLYGDSTAGKSFVALDLAIAIARGDQWHGRRTARGPVLYLCMEGSGGFQLRVLACAKHRGEPGKMFALLPGTIQLAKGKLGDEGIREVIASIGELEAQAGEKVAAVIIDTLQRAMGGDDENDTSEMANFVARLGRIQSESGAAVLLCHHTNAQGKIRGSTVLFASCDLVVRVEKDRARRRVVAEKVKDGTEGPLFNFGLNEVDVGCDATGKRYSSAVVTVQPTTSWKVASETKPEKKQVRVFREAAAACLVDMPDRKLGPVDIPAEKLERAFREKYPTGQSEDRTRKSTLARYWRELTAKPPPDFEITKIEGEDIFIWTSPPDSPASGSRISRIFADNSKNPRGSQQERIPDSRGLAP